MISYCFYHMVQHVCTKVKKETVHDSCIVAESEEFDIDRAIESMKKVGYRNSEGYLVLPKYYDE